MIKKLVFWAKVFALAFAPVFLIKILLNNNNCITIMEPIPFIRYLEAFISIYIIIFLGLAIIGDLQ